MFTNLLQSHLCDFNMINKHLLLTCICSYNKLCISFIKTPGTILLGNLQMNQPNRKAGNWQMITHALTMQVFSQFWRFLLSWIVKRISAMEMKNSDVSICLWADKEIKDSANALRGKTAKRIRVTIVTVFVTHVK